MRGSDDARDCGPESGLADSLRQQGVADLTREPLEGLADVRLARWPRNDDAAPFTRYERQDRVEIFRRRIATGTNATGHGAG